MAPYDPSTALVIVDVQNDFADPAGGLAVRGGAAIVPVLNAHVGLALAAGSPILYTQDWHPMVTPHFAKDGGIWPVHCVAGTWALRCTPISSWTGRWCARAATARMATADLPCATRRPGRRCPRSSGAAGVRRVVVGGLATDYCVKATALDARRLGYPTFLLIDAIAAVDLAPGDGERAVAEMVAAGVEPAPG